MESPRNPRASTTSRTRRNIFARAVHKVSKRLSKLFSRRGTRDITTTNTTTNPTTNPTNNLTRQLNIAGRMSLKNSSNTNNSTLELELELLQFLQSIEGNTNQKPLHKFITEQQKYILKNKNQATVGLLFGNIKNYNESTSDERKERILSRINKNIEIIKTIVNQNKTVRRLQLQSQTARLTTQRTPQTQQGGNKKSNKNKKMKTSKMLKKSRC